MKGLNLSNIGKKTYRMRTKTTWLFAFCIIAMLFLIYRIAECGNKNGEQYKRSVLSQYQTRQTDITLYEKRGEIYDRNGVAIATNIKTYNVILDAKVTIERNKSESVVKFLSESFGASKEELDKLINEKKTTNYYRYKKNISETEYEQIIGSIDELGIYGCVWFENEYIRFYPYNSLASDVIGFTAKDGIGIWGLEKTYDEELTGESGREFSYINSESNVEKTIRPAQNGNSLITTLDQTIQYYIESEIEKTAQNLECKSMSVIMINPNNGEIMGMANYPSFDLNNPTDLSALYSEELITAMSEDEKQSALNQLWRNESISDTYEPGSTIKPFTVAKVLEENLFTTKSTFECDGIEHIADRDIKCGKVTGHGIQNLGNAISNSCNDVMMQISSKLGIQKFARYDKLFGFGQKTGIDLIGEESAAEIFKVESNMSLVDLAVCSFGQTNVVTPIQLISGFASLINGGKYYEPHLVKQIVTDEGNNVKTVVPTLRNITVSSSTSDIIKDYLHKTVEEGTGKNAKIAGYEIGGKTATAEKLPRGNGKYVISFMGFAPVENPQVLMLVVIDEPEMEKISTTPAIELFKAIFEKTLPYLDIYPVEE